MGFGLVPGRFCSCCAGAGHVKWRRNIVYDRRWCRLYSCGVCRLDADQTARIFTHLPIAMFGSALADVLWLVLPENQRPTQMLQQSGWGFPD
ncbi:MAG TPA: hypothetical protein DD416_03830 [Rhodobacteraceae bacterium]|nr:hypothetical protein [Paracoccaceae bacterium]